MNPCMYMGILLPSAANNAKCQTPFFSKKRKAYNLKFKFLITFFPDE